MKHFSLLYFDCSVKMFSLNFERISWKIEDIKKYKIGRLQEACRAQDYVILRDCETSCTNSCTITSNGDCTGIPYPKLHFISCVWNV